MQKHLLICRHAQTQDPEPGQPDFERQLTEHGRQQAQQAGSWILQQDLTIQALLSSAATRTHATANLIVDQLGYLPDKVVFDEHIYRAEAHEVVNVLSQLDNMYNNVLLVGHNPAMSALAENLTGRDIGHMTPASIIHIRFPIKAWEEIQYEEGELVNQFWPT